ncbi:DUF2190 family protein [Leptospira bouyouniensis]|uniref:DUF2190 family protein n=1 Tax=Leptospira bouyouniensis TaxID=2484911 RepID=A0ABY2L2Y2_9LEPT|nr:DUF2190 family protein [Leptospira bouyouniensis]TGK45505.1 hypothetical protein EHQ10_18840 [Leptospira bouyouniensis]
MAKMFLNDLPGDGGVVQAQSVAGSNGVEKGIVSKTGNVVSFVFASAKANRVYLEIKKANRVIGDKLNPADSFAKDDVLYWSSTTGGLTKTATDNWKVGVCLAASPANATQAEFAFDGMLGV